ncbi:type II secretion system protein [Vibrio hippocampi]|uniref:MSHA biogenesis protein MshO n=1 Tax=Vibrio hippocampi TaxID=654686 RepID=A0ABM8ZJ60_9VIBR|nr:type II secretion system protein [Vibrio hippocampi]CAH0526866.1 hypothetical protein VHP8226_02242 [Vibrio hippocampi]
MKQRGFTLVEMILTVVILGILMVGSAGFLRSGTEGFVQSVERQKLHTQAQFILEKISREIRHAIPNSFTISDAGHCIEFYPIKYSGFYHLEDDTLPYSLSFFSGQSSVKTLGRYGANDFMVINPTSAGDIATNQIDIANVAIDSNDSISQVMLTTPLTSESVSARHYIADFPVKYCYLAPSSAQADFGTIVRRSPASDSVNQVTVADSVEELVFQYHSATLVSGSVIHLALSLGYNTEVAIYEQDIQVLNVP